MMKRISERIELERAGIQVLADAALRATGIERARAEVRLDRQRRLVADLERSAGVSTPPRG